MKIAKSNKGYNTQHKQKKVSCNYYIIVIHLLKSYTFNFFQWLNI